MDNYILKIKVNDDCPRRDEVVSYYQSIQDKRHYDGDSGIDLIIPDDTVIKPLSVTKVNHGIRCEMINKTTGEQVSYLLMPRSSLAQTPLMLTNSIGLIDAGYRGDILSAFRYTLDHNHLNIEKDTICVSNLKPYNIEYRSRLVQIVAPNLGKIKIELVDSLTTTERGEKGFGSTN